MHRKCWATCAALRSRTSAVPMWCAIRWWRASSKPTMRRPPGASPTSASAWVPMSTRKNTPAAPRLKLSVQFATPEAAGLRAQLPRAALLRWVKATLFADAELTLRFVDSDEGRALNRTYRGKDYATNVLTFAYAQNHS